MRVTTLPFLLALVMAIAHTPTDIYQICWGGHGTEHTEPWRSTLTKTWLVQRTIAIGTRVRAWLADLTDVPLLRSEVGAVGHINQLIQQEKDTAAAIAKLKKEGRALYAIPATALAATATTPAVTARTPEQSARLTAVVADLDALENQAETIAADLVLARRLQDDERHAPTIQVGDDHASERAWGPTLHADATPEMRAEARQAALGEFAIAVRRAMSGEGADPRLFAAATGMGTAVPSEGGFAVPHEVAAGIERDMFAQGELLSRVDARTISGDSIAYNVIDETSRATTRAGGVLGYWVDQGTAPTASMPKLARLELKLRKVGALGYMTDELVNDAAGLGGELQAMFGEELTFQVEDAVTEGTGAGQPLGYLVAPCVLSIAKETGQGAASINVSNLSKMWARLPSRSKKNSIWAINTDCNPQLDLLSIPAGAGALEPRFVNYDSTGVLTIKGRPVVETEFNATIGTVGDIALLDLSRYRLIRKGGVEQASSIHVLFASGQQTFRAFYRCDGQPVPRSALTPFKGTQTQSPFIVLATRA